MTKKSEHKIRKFIIDNISNHSSDIATFTAGHFCITRQAVNLHLKILVKRKILNETGKTRNKQYQLRILKKWISNYFITEELAEDRVWSSDILPRLLECSENAVDTLHHAFTEMFNNAIDHSKGTAIHVDLSEDEKFFRLSITDDGIGIFKNIKEKFKLQDENHAVFELTKGKLTTAPKQHTSVSQRAAKDLATSLLQNRVT